MEKDKTDFVPVVVWNQIAENINAFCTKGSKILVDGRLQISSYEKDGQKRYTTEVVADRVEFLSVQHNKKEENPYKDMSIKTEFDIGKQIQITDDDLPF